MLVPFVGTRNGDGGWGQIGSGSRAWHNRLACQRFNHDQQRFLSRLDRWFAQHIPPPPPNVFSRDRFCYYDYFYVMLEWENSSMLNRKVAQFLRFLFWHFVVVVDCMRQVTSPRSRISLRFTLIFGSHVLLLKLSLQLGFIYSLLLNNRPGNSHGKHTYDDEDFTHLFCTQWPSHWLTMFIVEDISACHKNISNANDIPDDISFWNGK